MKPNPVVWFEIYVQDMARARKFYETVLQCQLETLKSPEGEAQNMQMLSFPGDMTTMGASGALVKMADGPAGVGGTHVMYVLHHADKPPVYAGLPLAPKISPLVEMWKGLTKNVGLLGIGFAAVFGFMHYVVNGPNRVSDEDEQAAAKLKGDGT